VRKAAHAIADATRAFIAFLRSDVVGLAACSLVALADMLTTYALLSSRAGFERGVVVGLLVSALGLQSLALYAPAEALLMYSVLRVMGRLRVRLGLRRRGEYAFLAVVAVAPVNNLIVLLFGFDLPSLLSFFLGV
jgi:hypothetical protein